MILDKARQVIRVTRGLNTKSSEQAAFDCMSEWLQTAAMVARYGKETGVQIKTVYRMGRT